MIEDRAHRVLMFAYPNAQIFDISGPLEVFGRTGRWLRDQGLTPGIAYQIEMVAAEEGPLRTSPATYRERFARPGGVSPSPQIDAEIHRGTFPGPEVTY